MKFSTVLPVTLTFWFVAFKLMGMIDWSWWWVLSPLWIGPAITISVIVFAFWVEVGLKINRK